MAKKTKAPRGMYQRESGMWYSRIAGPDGKLIRKPLAADLKTAFLMLNEMRKQAALRKVGILPDAVENTIKTFAELHDRYLKHYKARGVSEATIEGFRAAYKRVVLENRFVYLTDMTLEKVEEWAGRIAAEGLTGQSINYYVGMIRAALRWAHDNGHVRKNALANWCEVRKNEPRYRRDFRPEEVELLFRTEKDPEWRLRWLIYFNTGLRLSAGLEVCWEWVVWEERILRLPLEHNKSRRALEIPLSAILFDALAARRAELGEARGKIFSAVPSDSIRPRLLKLCREAGIDPKGICVHSIRHTVATMIYEGTGKNLKAVQEILGHSNPATTMRYLHVTGEDKRRAIDSLGFGLGGTAEKKEDNDSDDAVCQA